MATPITTPNATELVQVTFSLDTNIYASGDVLADTQEIAGAMRFPDECGLLQSITLIDEDDQAAAQIDVVILKSNVSLGTENAAVSISDANAREILGIVSIASGDWVDVGGAKVATVRNIALPVQPASGTTSIYVGLITRGTPTQTASGIRGFFGFLRD